MAARLEAWGRPSFETRRDATLLRMRRSEAGHDAAAPRIQLSENVPLLAQHRHDVKEYYPLYRKRCQLLSVPSPRKRGEGGEAAPHHEWGEGDSPEPNSMDGPLT